MVKITSQASQPLKLSPSLRKGAMVRLELAGKEIVEDIKARYYAKHPNSKKAQGWTSRIYKVGDRRGILEISNAVPFAAIEEPFTITMHDKLLAIPQDPALNDDGDKKYPKGPMGYKMFQKGGSKELRPVMSRTGALLLMRVNKKHEIVDNRAWWRLLPQVHVRPNTPGLTGFITNEADKAGAEVLSYFRKVE